MKKKEVDFMLGLIGFILHGLALMIGWKLVMVNIFNFAMLDFFQSVMVFAFVMYFFKGVHFDSLTAGLSEDKKKTAKKVYQIAFPIVFVLIMYLVSWISKTNFAQNLIW